MNARLVANLCRASERDAARPAAFDWPDALPQDAWCFAPEWVSLAGTPAWDALADDARRRVAFHEAINFFSLNVHGERLLIDGLARRLAEGSPQAAYLAHFAREESEHTRWFREFCARYAGKLYTPRGVDLAAERAPGEEELVFFTRVMVFEEVVDACNAAQARDERLPAVVRRIHALHHRDESRHLAFGRALVRELWERRAPLWPAAVVARVRDGVAAYLEAVWADHYNAEAYRDAGLPAPFALRRAAWEASAQVARRARVTAPARRFLAACGLLPKVA